ncbi:MAG: hypothetical protein P8X89_14245 [Reinekea sp.]
MACALRRYEVTDSGKIPIPEFAVIINPASQCCKIEVCLSLCRV